MTEPAFRRSSLGPLGRLAFWSATHGRRVATVWLVLIFGLGAFVPFVQGALAGSGMEGSGSESVKARDVIRDANPLVASSALSVIMRGDRPYVQDPDFRQAARNVARTLAADEYVKGTLGPRASRQISPDGRTAIVTGGSGGNATQMIRAAKRLRDRVQDAAGPRYEAHLGGLSAQWADFNRNNQEASVEAEKIAFPITMLVLAIAFGSLVAAGLPLLITLIGLAVTGGVLFIGTQFVDISLWSLEFVLIFSLALGIDYALFLVMRFRDALKEDPDPAFAVAKTMDTAGRAVAFSAVTVLVASGACFLIPSPMPRAIALGIWLSVSLVLAVSFTLLPLILAKLGPRIDAGAMPWRKRQLARAERTQRIGLMTRWGEFIWRHPWPLTIGALAVLAVLAMPLSHAKIGIPGENAQPKDAPSRLGAAEVRRAFGLPKTAPITVAVPARDLDRARAAMGVDPDLNAVQQLPVRQGASHQLLQAELRVAPDSDAAGEQIDHLRELLPGSALVGHAPAELHDFRNAMQDSMLIVIGFILLLGSILLLVAVQAPLIALVGTITSLLSTAAAFGISILIFQDGHFANVLGFEPQGFLDFWAPVFFFAMIFAIAMDYTVFFISAAREQFDVAGDPRAAIVTGMGRSGPVIVAAAAAMVSVYGTFALSGALPAKEMGTILGLAVLLDAFLVRLTLLPCLLRLAGPWAWWQPLWLKRILPSFSLSHDGGGHAVPLPAAGPALAPAPATEWFSEAPAGPAPGAAPARPPVPAAVPVGEHRTAILDAARDLFAEHGFAGVGIADIAARAGVSAAEVHEHYQSADEILATLFDHTIDRVLVLYREDPRDPWRTLAFLVRAQVQVVLEDPARVAVWLHEERALADPYRRRVERRKQEHIARWLDVLRQCRPECDDEELVLAIHGTIGLLLSSASWPAHVLMTGDPEAALTTLAYDTLGVGSASVTA